MELIAKQWDKNVEIRAKQLENNEDKTYKDIVVPSLLKSLKKYGNKEDRILDFGCGCGHLTNIIKNEGYENIYGIDISMNSVKYAQNHYKNIKFSCIDISSCHMAFNYVVANMVFHSCRNIENIIRNISKLLLVGGHLTFIIPNPHHWLINKGYVDESNFDYNEHKEYSIPSIAHLEMENIQIFHRPLEYYIKILAMNGFTVSIDYIYTKYENPHIVKIDAKKIINMALSEQRLAKLHEMIYISSDIPEEYKQPLYTLLGNRFLNNCKLPPSSLSYKNQFYYKDFIDNMDQETLRLVFKTIRKSTLENYINDNIKISESKYSKIRNYSLLSY